ncbi:hypothetical protein AUO95_15085 [Corynebacterium glutamicum]|nr:hypothetical protein AUO95_15085 [Corynebacterium glutamicum]
MILEGLHFEAGGAQVIPEQLLQDYDQLLVMNRWRVLKSNEYLHNGDLLEQIFDRNWTFAAVRGGFLRFARP